MEQSRFKCTHLTDNLLNFSTHSAQFVRRVMLDLYYLSRKMICSDSEPILGGQYRLYKKMKTGKLLEIINKPS
jgi:hypothetical protein